MNFSRNVPFQVKTAVSNFVLLILDQSVWKNPYFVEVICDFNEKPITNFEENVWENIFLQFELHLMINNRILISDTYSLCIDPSFTFPPNLVIEPDLHQSLHSNFHDQITSAKLNLKINCFWKNLDKNLLSHK